MINPHHTQLEVEDFFNSHDGYDILYAYDIVEEQMSTDDLVEDSFLEALVYDLHGRFDGDLDYEEWDTLYNNQKTVFDLCDIVEATEQGYIIT